MATMVSSNVLMDFSPGLLRVAQSLWKRSGHWRGHEKLDPGDTTTTTPLKIKMEPQKGRFGSDDFSFLAGAKDSFCFFFLTFVL